MKIEQVAASEEVVAEIIGSFQTLLQRILESYRLAIHGYFRFLQFAALEFECSQPKAKVMKGLITNFAAKISFLVVAESTRHRC